MELESEPESVAEVGTKTLETEDGHEIGASVYREDVRIGSGVLDAESDASVHTRYLVEVFCPMLDALPHPESVRMQELMMLVTERIAGFQSSRILSYKVVEEDDLTVFGSPDAGYVRSRVGFKIPTEEYYSSTEYETLFEAWVKDADMPEHVESAVSEYAEKEGFDKANASVCPVGDCDEIVFCESELHDHCLEDHGFWQDSYSEVFA